MRMVYVPHPVTDRSEDICRKIIIPSFEPVEVSVHPSLKIARTVCIHPHVGRTHVGNVKRHQISMVVWKTRPERVCFLEK